MKNKDTDDLYISITGIILIILGILAFYNAVIYSPVTNIFWFSYAALFLIGLGILTRNSYLIASQLNIIFIPYIIWNIDFFYVLLTSESLWGITDYFFSSRLILSQIITLQHIFIIPLSLITLYFIKIVRKDFWKLSLLQVTLFFFIILIFGNATENVNCVFKNCLPFHIPSIPYPLLWFASYIIMISATNQLLRRIKSFNR